MATYIRKRTRFEPSPQGVKLRLVLQCRAGSASKWEAVKGPNEKDFFETEETRDEKIRQLVSEGAKLVK